MTMVLAMGAGLLMTAMAVAIGGLAIEMVLIALSRSLQALGTEQAGSTTVIHFKTSENTTGTMEWAEEAAA